MGHLSHPLKRITPVFDEHRPQTTGTFALSRWHASLGLRLYDPNAEDARIKAVIELKTESRSLDWIQGVQFAAAFHAEEARPIEHGRSEQFGKLSPLRLLQAAHLQPSLGGIVGQHRRAEWTEADDPLTFVLDDPLGRDLRAVDGDNVDFVAIVVPTDAAIAPHHVPGEEALRGTLERFLGSLIKR